MIYKDVDIMRSSFFDDYINMIRCYDQIVLYGAGGVAEDFFLLLEPYLNILNLTMAVSKTTEQNISFHGYPIKNLCELDNTLNETYVIIAVMPDYIPEIINNLIKFGFSKYTDVYSIMSKLYEEIWQNAIVNNKIVFSVFKGQGFGCNSKYVALGLLKDNKKYDEIWVVNADSYEIPEGIRTVRYGTIEYYYELGTSHIWVENQHKSRLTYKRSGQYYIQTWHGGGPLKRIEHDGNGISKSYLDLCDYNSDIIDLMISPSKFNSDLYRKAFHYFGEVMECGYPRNDILVTCNKTKQNVLQKLSLDEDDIIVLFAPTFRKNIQEKTEFIDLRAIRKTIETLYKKRVIILVRTHVNNNGNFQNVIKDDCCINVSEYPDIQELMLVSSMLITDYSSVMWDFSLQKKPVFLFHPDLEVYAQERGYYLDFKEMPYVEALTMNDLINKIIFFDRDKYISKLEKFIKEYGSFDKGNATISVVNRIKEICKM